MILGNKISARSAFACLICIFSMSSRAQVVDILTGPVVNAANGHVYYLISPLGWHAAESIAQDFGGHLATVRNTAEQNWLWSTFNVYEGTPRSFWIGFYDPDPNT